MVVKIQFDPATKFQFIAEKVEIHTIGNFALVTFRDKKECDKVLDCLPKCIKVDTSENNWMRINVDTLTLVLGC